MFQVSSGSLRCDAARAAASAGGGAWLGCGRAIRSAGQRSKPFAALQAVVNSQFGSPSYPGPNPGNTTDRPALGTECSLPDDDADVPAEKPDSPRPRLRDPDRTKARIFQAAADEFAARGFDGARMDKIAELAGINKRMIYVYWGDKQELYHEILRQKVRAMHEVFTTDWGSPAADLVRYFEATLAERELLRFIQWEALGDLGSPLVAEDDRRATFGLKVDSMRRDQGEGRLTAAIPPDVLMLVFMALSSYPVAFAQNVRLVTGRSPDDPEFQEQWASALETLGGILGGDAADRADDESAS